MVVTVLFPEFIFSKAVCELQMADDDLVAMKAKEDKLEGWKVECGRGVQRLYTCFNYFNQTQHI